MFNKNIYIRGSKLFRLKNNTMRQKLFSTIIIALLSLSAYAQPAGWQYNLPITITNGITALYNYAMPITINTQALIAANQMQPNGSDIRFGSPCTGTKMNSFCIISGINTTSTLIYVKIDTLRPNESLIIYMFYGAGPYVAPASTYSILAGPVALDAPLGTINNFAYTFYNDYTFGSEITPNQNLIVTNLGKYCYSNVPYTVGLWDNLGNLITQTNVTGSANTYDYTQLSSPVLLSAGSTYTVGVYYPTTNAGVEYSNCCTVALSPQVTFLGSNARTGGGFGFPNNNFGGNSEVYGVPDMKYYYAASVPNPPGYYIGSPNSGGITGQPSNLSVCVGNSGSFSAFSPASNQSHFWETKQGSTWVHLSNGSPYSGVNTSVLTITGASATMNGNEYRDSLSNSCGSGLSNTATLSIVQTAPLIPTASISGPNPACLYVNSLYTITTNVNGGSYEWIKNNTVVSTNQTYAYQVNNNDQLYAIVTAPANGNLGCYSLPTAISNLMTITTGSNFFPTAAVTTNNTNVCDGTQVNFTLSTNVYGGSYQWQVNGVDVGINSPGYTYIPANGDQVSCTITAPSNGCYGISSVSSLPLAVVTTPSVTPVTNLSALSSAPEGSSVNLYLTILNLNAPYYILWYRNGVRFDSTTTPSASFIKGQGTDYIKAWLYPTSDESIGACYASVLSNQVSIDNSTASVNTIASEKPVSVNPNPFKSEIAVNGLMAGDNVCIYDITGRMVSQVWNITNNDDQQKFNINAIAPGTYFLKVVNSNGNARSVITLQKM